MSMNIEDQAVPADLRAVVGIGASAGGLEALEAVFDTAPDDAGIVYVVVTRLSPNSTSLMEELLAHHTSMKVKLVEDGMVIHPNEVYVIPPNTEMIVVAGRLLLLDREPGPQIALPIDNFFRSLAREFGDRAVAVLLSGTGGDGSHALDAVRNAGGKVFVQDPGSASFVGMPNAAIQTGRANEVLPPSEIGMRLQNLSTDLPTLPPNRLLPQEISTRTKEPMVASRPSAQHQEAQKLSAYGAIVERYSPPGLLIDGDRQLVDTFGGARNVLCVPEDVDSLDVLLTVPEGLRLPIAAAIDRVNREGKEVRYDGATVGDTNISITVIPTETGTGGPPGHKVILLEEEADHAGFVQPIEVPDASSIMLARIEDPEDEIGYTRENLATTVKEGETSKDELQSANEELMAAIEELQSTNEELARSNSDLENFAHFASHDLREPARKIGNFAHLLRADLGDQLTDDGAEYLNIISRASERMLALVQDLLNFSRVKAATESFETVKLGKVLASAAEDMVPDIRSAGGKLTIGDMPELEGDALLLGQLFDNLISNAIKYRSVERELAIDISSRRDGDHWAISVKDNGIGFDMGDAEQIFGLFQRLHGPIEIPGTGVGLAICKRVVELHGGAIEAESSPGNGATFTVRLPA